MTTQIQDIIRKTYSAFNERDIDKALLTMHPDVQWPKAFEGGYVSGHNAVRSYWTRQWIGINPHVEPVNLTDRSDGRVEAAVHQVVKDLDGNTLFDGMVKHVYTFENGLISKMDIEEG